jgi:hypothetical protein
MKGYNQKSILFKDLKNKFYSDIDINIPNFKYIEKRNLELKTTLINKTFSIKYDKRIFINNKKDTKPFTYADYTYK